MKRIIKVLVYVFSVVILFSLIFYILYRFSPAQFIKLRTEYYKAKSGLKENFIEVNNYKWSYLYNDKETDTIVFIHGFTGSKLFWLEFANFFKDYRIIIPDMPGHGNTSYFESDNYSVKENVKRLNSFLETLKIKNFFLIGISLGGSIAGYYTYLYPERVKKLILIDSAGARAKNISPYFKYLLTTGENILIFKDRETFKKMYSFLMVNPPEIPQHIIDYYIEEKSKINNQYEKIFADLVRENTESGPILNEKVLNTIKTPTLIIWGKEDKIIDISSAYNLNKNLKNSNLFIIDNVGHVPPIEAKELTATKIKEFIEK